jgi:calcium-dependent protein kinase
MYGDIGAREEVDRIYKSVDVDHSGEIDFSEFLAASVDKSALFTDVKLRAAYNSFDRDGCGHLKVNEIKSVLGVGKNISDSVWNDVIKEVDVNGDGEIEFDEFKTIMMGLLDQK